MAKKALRRLAIAVFASVVLIAVTPAMADEPVVQEAQEPDLSELEHGMGLIFTPDSIMRTFPRLPLGMMGALDATQLPAGFDHSAGLPPVGDQGPKGTCVAWASTYYYRTYQEGIAQGWSLTLPDGSPDPDHVFSPAWTFSLGGTLDDDCSGMMSSDAFALFHEKGATTLSVMPNVYSPWYPPTTLQEGAAVPYRTAATYNLTGYPHSIYKAWLSGGLSISPEGGDIFNIAIDVPDGFHDPAGTCPNMWVDPALIETQPASAGHLITVIGYSDTIRFTGGLLPTAVYTGGFQIINSWGQDWGCDGKVWLPYDAWDATLGSGGAFVREAWGMLDLANYTISGQVTSGGMGLAGVEMRLNNNPYLATTTDASGYYTLTPGYSGYTLTVKPIMEGYTFNPMVAALAVTTDTTGVDFVATMAAPNLSSSTKAAKHPVIPNTTPAEFTVNVKSTGAGTSFVLTDVVPLSTTYVANSAQAAWGEVHAEGDLMPWEALTPTLNTARYGLSAEIGQDSMGTYYVYAIGGHDTATQQTLDTAERARINPDGSLEDWEVMAHTLNTARAFFDTVMLNVGGTDYIYAIGGGQGYTATEVYTDAVHMDLTTVERAPVNADGTVGPWKTLAATLVTRRSELSVVSDGTYMYAIGGTNWDSFLYPNRHGGDNPLNSVEYARINADGTLGAWALLPNNLRDTRNTADAVIVDGDGTSYIELIGGRTGGNVSRSYGERAEINADGTLGSWSISERLHYGRYGTKVVAVADHLYAVGGRDHGGPLAEVDRTQVHADGTMAGWQLSPGRMVTPRSDFGAVTHDGRIYAIGGRVTELYCVNYYDVGSGCGYAIDSAEVTEPVEPGTVWWSGELGQEDELAITLSVMPQTPPSGTPLPPGSVFTNIAEIEDHAAGVTSVSQAVHIMDVDMEGAEKEVYPDEASLMETLTFTITLPNDGGWSKVSIADKLPAGLEYVYGSAQASSGAMGTPGEVWSWTESDYGPVYNRVYFDLLAPGNGFLYAIGPWYDTEYAPINPDGSLGEWDFATNMSTDRMGVAAVAPGNGYIYAVGGGPNGDDALSTTERAEILPDGSLGEWEVLTSTLVHPRSWHNVVAPGNGHLYALSGFEAHNYTSYTSTEYCEIYADGTLGPWVELEATVNHTRDMAGAVAYNGYIYIVGGEDWNIGSDATVEYAKVNADGTLGDFVVSPNRLNYARDTFGLVEVNGILYAIAGRQWGTVTGPDLDVTEAAEIQADGSVGPWTVQHGRLPVGLGFASAEASDDHIYVVDHWSAYYTEILDSVVWEGEVDYEGEAVLAFEATLAGPTESETVTNTVTIEHSTGTLDRNVSFISHVKSIYLPLLMRAF
jgi:cathepsin K